MIVFVVISQDFATIVHFNKISAEICDATPVCLHQIKNPAEAGFLNNTSKRINVLRIVDAYALCVGPLSYVQLYEHHVLRNLLYVVQDAVFRRTP